MNIPKLKNEKRIVIIDNYLFIQNRIVKKHAKYCNKIY